MRAVARLGVAFLAVPAVAHAHGGSAEPGWTLDPWVTVPLAVSLALYVVGLIRLTSRSGRPAARLRRAALFTAGWCVLAAAVLSPLHAAGARSFTAHMLEHELMMLAAAPLLVLSRPLGVFLWGLPAAARRGLARLARGVGLRRILRRACEPVTATLLQAAALWLWHAPSLFERALASSGWHIAQHLSFLLTAVLFWQATLARRPRQPALAALCLFATSVVSGALGAMMAFSPSPWYRPYELMGLSPFGLTPAEDQQLAGLLMWIPGGAVHAAAALAVVAALLRPEPREVRHAA